MLNEEKLKRIEELKKYYPNSQSLLLPVLWMVQEQEGYISESAMKYVSELLKVPLSQVLGVVTFYTMFKRKPVGKYHIQVCNSISCSLCGCSAILEHLQNRLGIKPGEVSSDGKWSLEAVECLGSCGTAPVIAIGDEYYEELTIEKIDKILDNLK